MLGQHSEESLDRAEQCTMNHHRPLPSSVRRRVFQAEPVRQHQIHLDGGNLPVAPDSVPRLDGDLRRIESGASGVQYQLQSGRVGGLAEGLGGSLPVLVTANRLFGIAGGELEVEVSQTIVGKQVQHELQQGADLAVQLVEGAVDMSIVLGHPADPRQPVHHSGELVAIYRTELEQPKRQLTIRAAAAAVDQVVHRAVHRLEVVILAGLVNGAVGLYFSVDVHGREHALGVPSQVTGDLEQLRLADVGGIDELVPRLQVALAAVVLHDLAKDSALGMKNRQSGADLVGE